LLGHALETLASRGNACRQLCSDFIPKLGDSRTKASEHADEIVDEILEEDNKKDRKFPVFFITVKLNSF